MDTQAEKKVILSNISGFLYPICRTEPVFTVRRVVLPVAIRNNRTAAKPHESTEGKTMVQTKTEGTMTPHSNRIRWQRVMLNFAGFIVLSLVMTIMPAFAQTAQASEFKVEAQPLDDAINAIADQAGVQIVFHSEDARGVRAPALEGTYTPEQALDHVLAGTGLEYRRVNERTLAVGTRARFEEDQIQSGGNNGSMQSAQAGSAQSAAQQAPDSTSVSTNSEPVALTGRVSDISTGTSLDGALVIIEETDQRTSTDDLGRFRFSQVRPGTYTVRVSFLGYESASATVRIFAGQDAQRDFELGGVADLGTIQVFGQRSARALALNQERTAENSTTVLSSDLLGQFEGATLAETLRRAPGIAFQEDPLTGDGTNVIVRGLAPDFNQIRLDGQRLAEGSGVGRSPAIGNLLTDSIDEVTISKTLLPSQDSNGAGGLIEITTRGPLDRARRYASFSAEGGANDGFEDFQQYSGILSGTFGDRDSFGLSLSLQYREESKETVGYSYQLDAFGQYLPLGADGNPVTQTRSLDPRLIFPFEDSVDTVYPRSSLNSISDVATQTLAGTFTAEWRPFDNTDLRLSYTRTEQDVDSTRRSLSFIQSSRYLLLPIDDLGGEIRGAYVWEGARGEGQPNLAVFGSRSSSADFDSDTTEVVSFQGETFVNQWTTNYRLSRSEGKSENIGYQFIYDVLVDTFIDLPPEFLAPEVFNEAVDGRLISLFPARRPNDDSYILPRLNEAGFAFFNNPSNYGITTRDEIDFTPSSGENLRDSAFFSLRRDFLSDSFRYLELGVEYEESRFDNSRPTRINYVPVSNLTLADLGITTFEGDILSSVGIDTGFLSLTDEDFLRLIENLDVLSSGSNPLLNPVEISTAAIFNEGAFTNEEELAIYLQGRFDIGDFEIIGGVRYAEVDVAARQFSSPAIIREDGSFDIEFEERNRTLVDQSAVQSVYLPRLTINYRPSENFVVRSGYFQTFSRPRVQDLSATQFPFLDLRERYGAGGDQPRLRVQQGNPDLEPSITHSYDLSIEWYDNNAGVIELSLFYKDIENFIEFNSQAITEDLSGIVLPDIPEFQTLPENIFVEIRQPINNDNPAEIYGAEINVERQFVQLPGAWGGLGIFANYTYSDSEKFFTFDNVFDPVSGEFVDIEVSGVPFDQAPKHSGTLAVTYNKYGIDASIAYTAQSERLQRFLANGLSRYSDEDDTLDLRFEYQFDAWNGTWRVFVAGSDLLKGTEDPDTLTYSSDKYYTSGTFFGGRTFTAGISAVF